MTKGDSPSVPCPFNLAEAAASHAKLHAEQLDSAAAPGDGALPRRPTTPPLSIRVGREQLRVQAAREDAERRYHQMMTTAATTSSATAKRIAARAATQREQRRREIAEMERAAAEARGGRLASFKRQASEDRDSAGAVARKLAGKTAGLQWSSRVRQPGDERQLGPVRVPRSMPEAKALLAQFPQPTPYEAAFLFVVGLNRLMLMRGPKSRRSTLHLLAAVLHPDCFCPAPAPAPPRIRKHVLLAMERCGGETARSFVCGSDPFNDYAVDAESLTVRVRAGAEQHGAYSNSPGAEFAVDVRTSGSNRRGDSFRQLGLGYVDGAGWRVRDVTALLTHRAVNSFDPDGPETADEHAREQAYREEHRFPPLPPYLPPSRPGSAYRAPRASTGPLRPVDLAALAAQKRLAQAAAAAAGLHPAERTRLDRSRQIRARERTAALAASSVADKLLAELASPPPLSVSPRPITPPKSVMPSIRALG